MTKPALRPAVLIIAAVAVTATATALITASFVGDDSVLSADDVDRQLAGATGTPTAHASATGQPTTTATTTSTSVGPGGAGDVVSTLTPGIVTLRCNGTDVTLVSWSPNPGWRADDPVRGPAAEVSVRFESDVAQDYKVTATCAGGVPVAQLGPDDHSGGGNHD
jgi:hypothetical protein